MKSIPRNTLRFSLLAAFAAGLLPACGGDDTTATGGTATTTTATGGTGGGDTGGSGGTGGSGASGGSGGSGGTVTGQADGSPCTASAECESGYCLTQTDAGWPHGYCTGACNSLVLCAPGSTCISVNNDPFCLLECELGAATGCGPGYTCQDPGTSEGVCFIKCTMDEECAGYGICNEDSGFCVVPEDCSAAGDEDGDGLSDCEDYDCASSCQPQLEAACGGGEVINAVAGTPIVKTGDNTAGTSLFAGSCSGSGNNEKVYKVNIPAAADGVLEVSLLSDTDLAVYVRATCGVSSDAACTDALDGGPVAEIVDAPVTKGTSVFVFVDGSSYNGATGNNGAYTLTTQLIIPQLETEPNNDQATATAISLAASPAIDTGALDQATDNDDWYLVDTSLLVGNKTITAETIGAGGDQCGPAGDVDTFLEIVAENGTVLDPLDAADAAENEDIGIFSNWCSLGEATDLPPGKYFVHVKTSPLCMPDAMGPDCAFKYGVKVTVK